MIPKLYVITGGIGSGKSVVSEILRVKGCKVYDCDSRAKYLNDHHPGIVADIIREFGPKAYINGRLNKSFISGIVFSNKPMLQKLNNIVHPRVREDILNWVKKNNKHSVLFVETAILKESNLQDIFNGIINVEAPIDVRIARVVRRNNMSEEDVKKRIANQNYADFKCNYSVINDNSTPLIPQINSLLQALTIQK